MIYKLAFLIVIPIFVAAGSEDEDSVEVLMRGLKNNFDGETSRATIELAARIGKVVNLQKEPKEKELIKGIIDWLKHRDSNHDGSLRYSELDLIQKYIIVPDKSAYQRQFDKVCKSALMSVCEEIKRVLDQPKYQGVYKNLNIDDPQLGFIYGEETLGLARALRTTYIFGGYTDKKLCEKAGKYWRDLPFEKRY